MFIPKFLRFVLLLISLFIDSLEYILEAAVVALEDCVLCAQIKRVIALESILETGVSESLN